MTKHPRLIGVCGTIGSGKSVVMRCLKAWHYPCFDCDTIAKECYHLPMVRRAIEGALGFDPVLATGSLDKERLRQALATSSEQQQLQAIIHQAVIDTLDAWCQQQNHTEAEFLFVESAILFTAGIDTLCRSTIAVIAPLEVRAQRVAQRDRTDATRFQQIVQLQEREEQALTRAHYTINNDNQHSIITQLEAVLSALRC